MNGTATAPQSIKDNYFFKPSATNVVHARKGVDYHSPYNLDLAKGNSSQLIVALPRLSSKAEEINVKSAKILSESKSFTNRLKEAEQRVISLCGNSGDKFSPNQLVKKISLEMLEAMKNKRLLPSIINSTGDESLLFEFFIGKDSYSIDIYNSGEIIYLERVQGLPMHAFEFTHSQIDEIVSKFLDCYARVKV